MIEKENKVVKFLKLGVVVILAIAWFVSSFKSVLF